MKIPDKYIKLFYSEIKWENFKTEKELVYVEKNGILYFSFYKEISVPTKTHAAEYDVYELIEQIPLEIQNQGENAIINYAEGKVKKYFEESKAERKKTEEFLKNPDFSVNVAYEGKILRGKIFSAEDGVLEVCLEDPFQGESSVTFGFGSAMAGHYILDEESIELKFSDYSINKAKEMLIEIYKSKIYEEQHRETIDLAEKLNKQTNKGGENE